MKVPGSLNSLLPLLVLLVAILVVPVRGRLNARPVWFRPVVLQPEVQQQTLNFIYQDKTGLIWIGTGSGVYSFDGMAFQRLAIPEEYKNLGAAALYEDAEKMMWIGYEDGSVVKHDRFGNFQPVLTGGGARITAFLEDSLGHMWIGTYGNGVLVKRDTAIIALNTTTGLSNDYIYSMISDQDGKIWLGTDNGVNICDPSKNTIAVSRLSIENGLPDFIVLSMWRDNNGDIWIGMYDKGICKYDREEKGFLIPPGFNNWHYGAVHALLTLNDRVWAATSGKGILEYSLINESVNFHEYFGDESLSRVRSMLHDREGNVWLLTSGNIYFSLAGKIEFFDQFGGTGLHNIHALTADREDKLWFANDRGLFSYSPNDPNNTPVLYPLEIDMKLQKIMSLHRDHFGFVWIGTFGQGLIRLDPETGKQQLITEADGLVNGNILSIAGNSNEIWFGTLGGATKCILDERLKDLRFMPEFTNFGLNEGLVNNFIYQVYLAGDGIPYFATDGNGVQVFREGKFINLPEDSELSKSVVYSVTLDDSGNTWMNIANEGLFMYTGTELKEISGGIGHMDKSFSGILSNLNELIISCDNGIDVFNLATGSLRHFEENAGIGRISPDLNTLASDSRHNVWIGTSGGMIRYQPQNEGLWEHPMTVLTDVALFLDKIDHRSRNIFSHRENHLSFTYSGLWYQYPEQVEYLFKLEGHDLDWIRTRNNQVIYSDLKSGHYTFRVKAGIYENYRASNEASFSFQIRDPFYSSLWFYLIALSGAGLAVGMILSYRIKQVRKKEEIIQERIRFQFENLKSQINPHFLFNSFSTLIALIEDDSRAAVLYVEELSLLFRNILEYKDHDLVSLEKEFEIAANYINLQKKRFGDSLKVEIEDASGFSGTKIPPLTLQLLIENAIKHNVVSRDKPLMIRIYSKPGEKRIFVENNVQVKIQNLSSTGIGLNNIINRYKLLTDMEVEVQRTDSSFTVCLPFVN